MKHREPVIRYIQDAKKHLNEKNPSHQKLILCLNRHIVELMDDKLPNITNTNYYWWIDCEINTVLPDWKVDWKE